MTWTRAAGFPKQEIGNDGLTVTDQYYQVGSNSQIGLPEIGDDWNIDTGSKLQRIFIEPDDSGKIFYADLTYSESASGSGSGTEQEDNDPLWILNNNVEYLAIDRDDDYLTNWNYNLAVREDNTEDTTSIWNTSTDTKLTAEQMKTIRWVKDAPPEPESFSGSVKYWALERIKTKKFEQFISPAPTVTEQLRFKDYGSVKQAAKSVGKKKTPGITYGYTTGEWLVMSATVQADGKRWLIERQYQWAPEWDSDIYDDA